MTGKRFKISNGDLWDSVTGEVLMMDCDVAYSNVVELLNNLHEENQQLQGRLETYRVGCRGIYDDKCKLEEENEKLKAELKNLRRLANELYMEDNE